MFSGLWLVALIGLSSLLGFAHPAAGAVFLAGFFLLWGGHLLSPILCVWAEPGLRAQIRPNRMRLVVFPLLLIVGSAVIGAFGIRIAVNGSAHLLANESYHGVGQVLFFGFLGWNLWHFAAQHFGVLSLYRARMEGSTPTDRRLDRWFCNVCTLGLLPIAWFTQSARLGTLMDFLPQPVPMGFLARMVIVLAGFLTLAAVIREWGRPRRSAARTIYLTSIGAQTAFGAWSYNLYHFAVFTMAHWMVAIALGARIRSESRDGSTGGRAFLMQLALLLALSIPMYLIFRSQAVPQWLVGRWTAEGGSEVPHRIVGAIAGLWIGISFTHFVYDQYLYSFRRPEIRALVAPRLLARKLPAAV